MYSIAFEDESTGVRSRYLVTWYQVLTGIQSLGSTTYDLPVFRKNGTKHVSLPVTRYQVAVICGTLVPEVPGAVTSILVYW